MELHRAEGLIDLPRVRRTTLVLAGLGSLGSQVADKLPYPFGQVILADPDVLKRENVERHQLGFSNVGRPKVAAMKDYLVDRGLDPETILCVQAPAETVLADCPDDTIVVASVDGYAPRAAINAICYERNFASVFGGVFARGTGGDIAVLPRPAEVCYLCSAWLTQSTYAGHENRDYGINPTEHTAATGQAVIPALKAPVGVIAGHMAMAVLELLSEEPVEPRLHRVVHQWESIFQFDLDDPRRIAVGKFISAMRDTDVEPNMRLVRNSESFTTEATRGIVSFVLSAWTRACPLHTTKVSLDDI